MPLSPNQESKKNTRGKNASKYSGKLNLLIVESTFYRNLPVEYR